MLKFEPHTYGSRCAELLQGDRLCELGPGSPNQAIRDKLADLDYSGLFEGCDVADPQMAACCLSGLWLLHDFLDRSHGISQSIHTATGSFWHGIMHRREPDYSNAKYWFRKVGDHPVFEPLAGVARQLAEQHAAGQQATFLTAEATWDPFAFVDFCQTAITRGSANEMLCRQIAKAEWELLFDHCYRRAIGQ
jgi:hypothetical protein